MAINAYTLWPWLTWSAAAVVLWWAARGLPWYKLRNDAEAQRVLIFAVLALIVLRRFNTDAIQGVQLHFLGATAVCLMFGPRFALWAMALASLVAALLGSAWRGWPDDFLATGVIAILITQAVGRFIEHRLPPNLLLYVWIRGFLAGALALGGSHALKAFVAWMGEDASMAAYLAAAPPMMFGEGFLCGGAIALIVVYRPHWCASFDDVRYLRKP